VLDALPPDAFGLATDVSKAAVRAAARAHPRADAVICDAWQPLPIADATVGIALDVFAPRPAAEFARVLRPDGVLLVVTPTADHLCELIEPLGLLHVDPDKADRVSAQLDAGFALIRRDAIGATMSLDHVAVRTLVGMGPSAWHTNSEELDARIARLAALTAVSASVTLAAYRPRTVVATRAS
jgi:23S rRNA (guanine745-N1)-methyltransferase